MANLSQLEKSLSELNQARLLLSNITERNNEKIKAFISSTNVQGSLEDFYYSHRKDNDLSAGTGIIEKNKENYESGVGEFDSTDTSSRRED